MTTGQHADETGRDQNQNESVKVFAHQRPPRLGHLCQTHGLSFGLICAGDGGNVEFGGIIAES
jgi:hypothetical protein